MAKHRPRLPAHVPRAVWALQVQISPSHPGPWLHLFPLSLSKCKSWVILIQASCHPGCFLSPNYSSHSLTHICSNTCLIPIPSACFSWRDLWFLNQNVFILICHLILPFRATLPQSFSTVQYCSVLLRGTAQYLNFQISCHPLPCACVYV